MLLAMSSPTCFVIREALPALPESSRCPASENSSVTGIPAGPSKGKCSKRPRLNEAFRIGAAATQRVVTVPFDSTESTSSPALAKR